MAAIPVQNIYYLLSYAWQLLEEGEEQAVATVPADNLLNLLTVLLLKNTQRLLRQGLAQNYNRRTATLATLKGKIDLTNSYKTDLLRQGKAICTFEELTPDNLPNQIIKAVIGQLLATPTLAPELLVSLRPLYRQLDKVSAIPLTTDLFNQLPGRLPNKYYPRVLSLCQMIHQNLLPEPGGESFLFQDFLEDEQQMGRLFELFVRNFLKQEQQVFRVKSEKINWQTDTDAGTDTAYLPQMVTDISLSSLERQIIIDTKFYKQALAQRYDKQKLISGHLYQLFAYLKNHGATTAQSATEGILLYPVTDQELDLSYQLHGHTVSIKTLNLAQPWPNIRADLLKVIA